MKSKSKKVKSLIIKDKKSVSSVKTETKNTAVKQRRKPPLGKPFKKGQSGNPNGRPRKLVSTIIEEMRKSGVEPLKQSQIIDAYEMLFQLQIEELKKHALDEKVPVFVRIIAKAMLSNKGMDVLEKMLDRAHGKAKQSLDVKAEVISDGDVDYSKLSDAALKEIISAKRL